MWLPRPEHMRRRLTTNGTEDTCAYGNGSPVDPGLWGLTVSVCGVLNRYYQCVPLSLSIWFELSFWDILIWLLHTVRAWVLFPHWGWMNDRQMLNIAHITHPQQALLVLDLSKIISKPTHEHISTNIMHMDRVWAVDFAYDIWRVIRCVPMRDLSPIDMVARVLAGKIQQTFCHQSKNNSFLLNWYSWIFWPVGTGIVHLLNAANQQVQNEGRSRATSIFRKKLA